MKSKILFIAVVSLAYRSFSFAQTLPDPSQCVRGSGITAFPQCKYLIDANNKCSVESGASAIACLCNQSLFNAYFECESESRQCLGAGDADGFFLTAIATWHSICDKRIAFTPTTPPISSITASFDRDYCTTVFSSCQSASYENDQCYLSYGKLPSCQTSSSEVVECKISSIKSFTSWLSCICQPKILSLDYTCSFLGNVSCLQTEAALANMYFPYRLCPNFLEVLGPASNSASPSRSTTASSSTAQLGASSFSITKPALPGDSSSTASPSSTKSSAGSITCVHGFAWATSWWVVMILSSILVA